ncbi:hypothetical protein L3X38_042207 [Prunus dulcis]|uniref:Uncharacterized protein n=1 Tax=Prunus dulcis TaxID=3755 RepID=A0AAD4UVH0_PRUDU|nr:hypothetical protein L3X38_042207 [Prunus dulcis]
MLGIDRILPNRQLEHEKWVRNHTSFIGIGGRRREIEGGEVRMTLAGSLPFFGEIAAANSGRWLGLEEDDGPVILVPALSSSVARGENGRLSLCTKNPISYSENLTRTPDFTGTQNLEKLVFEGCTNIVKIHPSIASLK